MEKTRYIQTDAHTANLTELLLEKLGSIERDNKELKAMVCTLTNPVKSAQLYTEKETASILHTSVKNLYILRRDRKINFIQDGKVIKYSLGDILKYEERCRR